MATHILWQADVADFEAWRTIFEQDKGARIASGILDMHVWKDPDKEDHAIALFAVVDLEKARAFFASENRAMHLERGGLVNVTIKLLEPA